MLCCFNGLIYDLFCALYCCSCCRCCWQKTIEEIEYDEMDDGYSVITSTTFG
jgi:hypothetical protein